MQMRWLLWFQMVFGISPRKMKHHNIELDDNRRPCLAGLPRLAGLAARHELILHT